MGRHNKKVKHTKSIPVSGAMKPEPKAKAQGMIHDKELLLKVFGIQNPSRNKACNDHAMKTIASLAPAGCTVVRSKGNLLVRKGPAAGPHPHFVSHMDQVHNYEPFMQVRVVDGELRASDGNGDQCGVGGDDKCGIYLALVMLHVLPHCTAVFVRDEEVGCLGSGEVPLGWFAHASFVLQADRNNRTMDVIRSTNGMNCASDGFMDAILDLPVARAAGHSENSGSITDIGELASRGLAVSMVNISSGYHSPHSKREVVNLGELGIALQLAYEAATTMGGTRWEHTPGSKWFRGSGSYGSYGSVSGYVPRPASAWDDEDVWAAHTKKPVTPARGYTTTRYEESHILSRIEAEEEAARLAGSDLQADVSDQLYREELIAELVRYGHDAEFDCLDNFSTEDLADFVDEERDELLAKELAPAASK